MSSENRSKTTGSLYIDIGADCSSINRCIPCKKAIGNRHVSAPFIDGVIGDDEVINDEVTADCAQWWDSHMTSGRLLFML